MNRTPVVSSNIESVGYDPDSLVLEVEFRTERIYHYLGVPEEEYDGLMSASSHGKYLARRIKGRYEYEKA